MVFASKGSVEISAYASSDSVFWRDFDRAMVARLVPGLETDSTRARLDHSFAAEFRTAFPEIDRTASRIESFLHGRD